MNHDPSRSETADGDVDTTPSDSTATSEPTAETGFGESKTADRSGLDADLDDGDEEFSWISPGVYFALIIGGMVLVGFPEPLTSFVGVVAIGIGLLLAVLDLLSPSGEVA